MLAFSCSSAGPLKLVLTVSRTVQYANTLFPMEVTLEGMVMDWRDLHSKNAESPMEVTLEGMVMDWRDLHPKNA